MSSFFKYIAFVSFCVVFTFGCGDDNDDFVAANDVTNINKERGIVFGFVDIDCAARNRDNNDIECNDVYRYTITNGVAEIRKTNINKNASDSWTFRNEPFGKEFLADGMENLPRGLRDFSIPDNSFKINEDHYVFEYETPAGRQALRFNTIPAGASDEIRTYLNKMIRVTEMLTD